MLNGTRTILFTSDLSETSRTIFNQVALLANQLQARIVMLHVIDKLPENYEAMLTGLFGISKWREVLLRHREEARHALLGKVTPKQMVRTALSEFCRESCTDAERQLIAFPYEIVVQEGEAAEVILQQAAEHGCDLIVLGAREKESGAKLGATSESVLRQAKVPTLVIPSSFLLQFPGAGRG